MKWNMTASRAGFGLGLGLIAAASGHAAVIHVPADFTTIQGAVDAAANGDTIRIAAGVYAEQVLITGKCLTLAGSPGAVLRAYPRMNQTLLPYGGTRVPLLGIALANVTVAGLTFEGGRLGDDQPETLDAIYFLGAGGRVEDCRISGFRAHALGAVDSVGVRVINPLTLGQDVVEVHICDNVFTDNWSSLWLMGDARPAPPPAVFHPELLRTRFLVRGNTMTGVGPNSDPGLQGGVMQAGIWILAGASGAIVQNVIRDFSYTGSDPTVAALGVFGLDDQDFGDAPIQPLQAVRIEANEFRDNDVHVGMFLANHSEIVGNSFTESAPGIRPSGIALSGDQVLVAANRLADMATGILLFGDDPVFSTVLGVATNCRLVANRFCQVSDPIVVEPLVTGTQERGNQLDLCR